MLYNVHAISDLLSELIVGMFYGRNRAAVHCAVSFLFTGSYRPTVLSFAFLYANVRDVAKKQFYFVRNLRMLRVVNRKLIFVQKNFHL